MVTDLLPPTWTPVFTSTTGRARPVTVPSMWCRCDTVERREPRMPLDLSDFLMCAVS